MLRYAKDLLPTYIIEKWFSEGVWILNIGLYISLGVFEHRGLGYITGDKLLAGMIRPVEYEYRDNPPVKNSHTEFRKPKNITS